MKKSIIAVLMVWSFLLLGGQAMATPISLSGGTWEEQSFSVTWGNFDPSLANQVFDWRNYRNLGMWDYGTQEFSLDLSVENIISADFSIILAGAGSLELSQISLNDFILGNATSGDSYVVGSNVHRLDTWPLGNDVISSLGQSNALLIESWAGDGYAFVGAELSGVHNVWVDNGSTGGDPVPEPATMLLFSTGLAGLVGIRSRKKIKK